MSVDAVVAVKIECSKLREKLGMMRADEAGVELEPGFELLRGNHGMLVLVRPLGDTTLVYTLVSMRGTEPDEIALQVRLSLGDALDAHDDARGLLAFPDAVEPKSRSWAELVEELDGIGEWIPVVDATYLPKRLQNAPAGSFESLAGQLMNALGGDLGELQRSLMSGDPDAMFELQQKMQSVFESPEGKKLAQSLGGAVIEARGTAIDDDPEPPADTGKQPSKKPNSG